MTNQKASKKPMFTQSIQDILSTAAAGIVTGDVDPFNHPEIQIIRISCTMKEFHWLVVVNALIDGKKSVCFHSAVNPFNGIVEVLVRIDADSMDWREDRPYTKGG